MNNQDEVREEFKAKLGNKLAYIGSRGEKHLDDIADFFFAHFATLLAKKREALAIMKGRVRSNEDYGIGFDTAIDEAIKILS